MTTAIRHKWMLLLGAIAWIHVAMAQGVDAPSKQQISELYRQLDEAIAKSDQYVADYEARIDGVKKQLQGEADARVRLNLTGQVAELYRPFNNDSALFYIERYVELADSMGQPQLANQARSYLAFQCSTVGLYTESLGILHGIDSRTLTQEGKRDYYVACQHVCAELAYYTRMPKMEEYYHRLSEEFRDSLYEVVAHDSEDYLLRRETQLRNERRFEEALKLNTQRLTMAKPDSRDYAIVSYYRHLIYLGLNNKQQAEYWLLQSALCDVKGAVMDQASLLALAEILNERGEFDRSYRYIRFTWDCNNFFNTRMRSWQISPILNVIENNYQNEIKRNTRVLIGSVVAISIIALLLLALSFWARRESRRLAKAQGDLKTSNERLLQANGQLESQTQELATLNHQLSTLNSQLKETNRVKEEYIGRFMSLCSQYINKLDDYRKMVNKKMKNKELDELFRLSKSTELKEKELEELYENFDSVFLHLFPNFVDDFNRLLLPEVQVHPKDETRLSTDIRIFALIRLGIEDSSKIAEFLHYSVNTIYNYRARIKNGAIGNREEFEKQVKMLGLPQ